MGKKDNAHKNTGRNLFSPRLLYLFIFFFFFFCRAARLLRLVPAASLLLFPPITVVTDTISEV